MTPTLISAFSAAFVGFVAFWANPNRLLNRVFFSVSIHVGLWLVFLHAAFVSDDGLFWLRITTSVGALLPLHIWFIKEVIVGGDSGRLRGRLRKSSKWAFPSIALSFVPLSEWFIPIQSTADNPIYGPGYHVYTIGLMAIYLALFVESIRQLRVQSGLRRLELQLLLLGGCGAAASILIMMAVRSVYNPSWLAGIRPQPIVVFFFYAVTVAAITTHRVFDARQIAIVGLQKCALVALISAFSYAAYISSLQFLPGFGAVVLTVGCALWLAEVTRTWLSQLFYSYPHASTARQAAFSAAQKGIVMERLEAEFVTILRGWGQTEHALLVGAPPDEALKEELKGEGHDEDVVATMKVLRWATPERLLRERPSAERAAVADFLQRRELGVLVIAEGPSFATLVGVGVAASRRPYTYPQVMELMELASIMESALERAHFSAKVQRTEQLATVGLVGASLAHEIRNPLVSIKTFVQLLPTHHQDPVFRDKFFRLIGEEVNRIDQLTEQLLDLSAPRNYRPEWIELHTVLRGSLDLVEAKAAEKTVRFFTEFAASPDRVFTDPAAAKQVMLNLCFNAIQAVESCSGDERWIKVATLRTEAGVEMTVTDSGPGIALEMHERLFQPFQTTKSTGFGLGLAICRDILANLQASISVDPPVTGKGATFRVTYPCQAS